MVHAKCPNEVDKVSGLEVNDSFISKYFWSRDDSYIHRSMGNSNYFTIIGHTPVDTDTGYLYNKEDNTLNIDGGNVCYVLGYADYDHSPLVEIDDKNNKLIILTFNNNEIICGNYFVDGKSINISDAKLNKYRKYLGNKIFIKK